MKLNDLLLIGGLAVGAYLLYKILSGGTLDSSFGGGGNQTGGGGFYTLPIAPTAPLIETAKTPSGYITPKKYVISHTQPTTTTVSLVGGRTYTTQRSGKSTYEGLITVGTPSQQIQQFYNAPKIVGGRKVM